MMCSLHELDFSSVRFHLSALNIAGLDDKKAIANIPLSNNVLTIFKGSDIQRSRKLGDLVVAKGI
jgi:hypothetical protein